MKYQGGKLKLIKKFKHIIQSALKESNGIYYEPFVGGANSFVQIEADQRIGSDIDLELIAFLNYLRDFGADNLPYITEEIYYRSRNEPSLYPTYLIGYISICGSFQGKKWGGYAGAKQYNSAYHDYPKEALNNIIKQSKLFKPSDLFLCKDYKDIGYTSNSVVYFDPPYFGTTSYKNSDFDTEEFWNLARLVSKTCKVFVSEYNAPEDFISVWSKERKNTLGLNRGSKNTENLFVYKG